MCAEQKKKSKTTKKKNTTTRARNLLTGDLTLQSAGAVKEIFSKAIAAKGDATFYFEKVDDVDLSFVQILCSAHRTAHEKGKKFNFEGEWPASFLQVLEESGLNVHVGCSLEGGVECPWITNKSSESHKSKN